MKNSLKAAPKRGQTLNAIAAKLTHGQRRYLVAAGIHPLGQVTIYPPSSGKLVSLGVVRHIRDNLHEITAEGRAIAPDLQLTMAR